MMMPQAWTTYEQTVARCACIRTTQQLSASAGGLQQNLLLQIFASLPVSTATPERKFSAMKILKTYQCSRLTEENMQGLSMAYIHKHIHIDIDEVIDHFALKKRRLQLC